MNFSFLHSLFCIPKPVPITRYIWYNKLYDIYREDGEAHA